MEFFFGYLQQMKQREYNIVSPLADNDRRDIANHRGAQLIAAQRDLYTFLEHRPQLANHQLLKRTTRKQSVRTKQHLSLMKQEPYD